MLLAGLKPKWLCTAGGVYLASLSVCVVDHGRLEVSAAERSLFFKVKNAGKVL